MSSPVVTALIVVACLTLQDFRVGAASERRLPTNSEGQDGNLPTATGTPPLGDLCQLPPYNIKNLTRENYWFANNVKSAINNGLQCFDPSAETCTFFIAFCHPLQRVNDTAACPEGAAVCQISKNANGNISSYSLGQFSSTTQFYESNGTVDGGFYVDVVNGSMLTWDPECLKKNSTGATTRIMFTCDSTQKWTARNLTGIIDVAYSKPCTFTITLPYAGACRPLSPTALPSSVVPSPSTSAPPTNSSTSVKPTNTTASKSTSPVVSTTVLTTSTKRNFTVSTTSLIHTTSTVPANTSLATSLPVPVTSIPTTSTPTETVSHHVTPSVSPTPKPPTPPPVTTTTEHNTPQPSKNYLPVVHGLTAGLVIFALLSVVFLLMLLYACRLLYVKGGQYRRVSNNDDM